MRPPLPLLFDAELDWSDDGSVVTSTTTGCVEVRVTVKTEPSDVMVLTNVLALCDVEENVVGSGAREVLVRVEVGVTEEEVLETVVREEERRDEVVEVGRKEDVDDNEEEEEVKEMEEEELKEEEREEEERMAVSAEVL